MWQLTHRQFLRHCACAVVLSTGVLPAQLIACRIYRPPVLEDVRYADVVVVGRILDYRIIRDEAFRRRMLTAPNLTADLRKIYEDPRASLLPDYARFDVQVEQVLAGRAPHRISVTWDNSTFEEPDQIAPGLYLIALRRPGSPAPPLRGPSATIFPSPDPTVLTLLQAPCSTAFLYPADSEQARTIRAALRAGQK